MARLCLVGAWTWALPAAGQALEPLVGVLHARSTASGGAETVEELAARAAAGGVDVLVLADSYHLSVEYGLPFLRRLVRFQRSLPSLQTPAALAAYLQEVERVDALYPRVVVLAGVELTPFYWWEAGLGRQAWDLGGLDRRLVVLGLDAQEVAPLPVAGSAALRVWHWSSLLLLWPLLGLAYAVGARGRHPAWLCYGVGAASLLFAIANAPFTVPLWDGYSGDLGAAPHQHLLDRVQAAGGLASWTLPQEPPAVPLRILGHPVRLTGRPGSAEMVAQTRGYAAFAALAGEEERGVGAGQVWDQVLGQHLRGERETPVWAVGERGTLPAGGEAPFGLVQTVLFVQERTAEGVLEALRSGRTYARRCAGPLLVLEEFSVRAEAQQAIWGGQVRSHGKAVVRGRVGLAGGRGERVQVQLIRDGAVVLQRQGTPPLAVEHRQAGLKPGQGAWFRLVATSRTGRLLSNPICVRGVEP
ncbi:MAG: hypothetical protein AB1505_07185 [Candidatus Latescibacterota bacterium]